MSLVDNGGNANFTMPVSPMYGGGGYGNNGFGWGDGSFWIIILFLFAFMGNGWGNGFGGFGGGGMMPWMMSNNTNSDVQRGFDQQAVMGGLNGITAGINSLAQGQCTGFAGVNATMNTVGNSINSNLTNGFYNAETAASNRQMANMNQQFAMQTGLSNQLNTIAMNQQNCCCENRAAVADLKYTVATENCEDRTQAMMNTRDIIEAVNNVGQKVQDKLCQLELDGVKNQLAQANRDNTALQNEITRLGLGSQIQQGFSQEVDNLYNRMKNCPVPSMPVYGTTPIFTCGQNPTYGGCGCGMA